MNEHVQVVFQPSGRRVSALPGTTILEMAGRAGLSINTPCGGAAKCGKCVIRVTSGTAEPTEAEIALLQSKEIADGYRLACCARATDNLTVEIPDSSLFDGHQQILENRHTDSGAGLELDYAGDERTCQGIAFDVGTTTIVGTLVDMRTGQALGVASSVNPQTSFGDDVISRITLCMQSDDGLPRLHDAVHSCITDLVSKLVSEAGARREDIRFAVFAGNTAMQLLLCNEDPSALGELPFEPPSCDACETAESDFQIGIADDATIYVLPAIGGFIGGDIVAGIAVSRPDLHDKPVLFIDIGTNGEVVLAHDGRMVSASCAAGPAFEGARIRNGMRATSGAIEKVLLDDGVSVNVIGGAKPSGLCGTGLIDAVAGMLRVGVLDSTGRVLAAEELADDVPGWVRGHLREEDGEPSFVLVEAANSGTGAPVCIYQKDIRELQLSKGAIAAGVNILLRKEDIKASELGAILLAGAFGTYVRRDNAKRIGLLPAVPSALIRHVGNTASSGAARLLLSKKERALAEKLARETEHVDLSLDPEFQLEFGEAMMFPGPEVDDVD